MLKNYFKIAFRNIFRNKLSSFINIFGLSLGMTISLLLLLWVQNELQYDRFHKNIKNIYQISMVDAKSSTSSGGRTIPYKLIPVTREKYSEVKNATRIRNGSNIVLKAENKTFEENNYIFAEPNLFEMFSFSFIEGDPVTALAEPYSIVLSESNARKFFGDEPALGKTILANNQISLNVTGIVENCPENSTITYDYILPFSILGERIDTWSWECSGFIELYDNVSEKEFFEKYKTALVDNSPRDVDRDMIYLQPFSRVHLFTPTDKASGMMLVYLFSIIGVIILIIACINFINLTTARSVKRGREVGVRKVVGAQRKQLIMQFLSESLIMSFIAMVISFVLLEILLPEFNQLTGKSIQPSFNNTLLVLGFPLILIFTGILSGIYPALFLSSYNPTTIFRLRFSSKRMKNFRRILVVFQFAISISLIILTFVIVRQLHYIHNKDLGLKKDSIVYMTFHKEYREKFPLIKEELLKNPSILNISAANTNPASVGNINPVTWEGKQDDDRYLFMCLYVDKEYLNIFEIPFVEGGNFQLDSAEESNIEYIVNEAAVKTMGISDPIGKEFSMFGHDGYIVGVVKDFHNKPLNQEIEPQLITQLDWFRGTLFIKLDPKNIPNSLKYIEKTLDNIVPGYPFQFTFVDAKIESMYQSTVRSRAIMTYFAILAVFISILGLFGLSSFIAEQRSKEVSIRKVFGSSAHEVILLLTGKFLRWVALATVVSLPVAWYFSHEFLKKFAYHINLGIIDFAFPILAQFVLAIIAVSYNTFKAANSNPIECLKYE